QDVSRKGVVREDEGRVRDRREAAAGVQPEPGVVAAAGAAVRDVDEAAVDRDARREAAVRGLDLDEAERAVRQDAQHGDLVAAGVGGEEVTAVGRLLEAAGRAERGAGAGAAGVERR